MYYVSNIDWVKGFVFYESHFFFNSSFLSMVSHQAWPIPGNIPGEDLHDGTVFLVIIRKIFSVFHVGLVQCLTVNPITPDTEEILMFNYKTIIINLNLSPNPNPTLMAMSHVFSVHDVLFYVGSSQDICKYSS